MALWTYKIEYMKKLKKQYYNKNKLTMAKNSGSTRNARNSKSKSNSINVDKYLTDVEKDLVHPTFRVIRQSCSAYSLSLKYRSSLKPYALRFITFILLFMPSTLPVEM